MRLLHHLLTAISLHLGLSAAEPQRIPVWPTADAPRGDGTTSPATTTLTLHRPEKPNGTAILICPGGGYGSLVTAGEGHQIAQWLNAHGITGLVLEYRLPQGHHQVPLLDAQQALRLTRANAGAWHIDPHRLGIIGFSAGGHLAATASTLFDLGSPAGKSAADPVARYSSRPDFAILIYPVISMTGPTHSGSRENLLGPRPPESLLQRYSADQQVSPQSPPTFLAHAKDDHVVPIENSRLFAAALKKHLVPTELLELPNGGHGLNGYQGPSWDAWQSACLLWLNQQHLLTPQPAKLTANATQNIPVTNPAFHQGLSPLNWIHQHDAVHSSVGGASLHLAFRNTRNVILKVDTSRLNYPSPLRFPILAWTVDQGPVQTHQLAAGETEIILSSGPRDPVVDLYLKGFSPFENRYQGEIPANAVTLTGLRLDPAATLRAPPSKPLWLNIGDSILSGDGAAYAPKQGRPRDDEWAGANDARSSYGDLLARHYGYRESRLAFGGYAWTGGLAQNPPLTELIDHITSTTSRLSKTAEKLNPTPQVVLINLGENGAPPREAVTTALSRLRQRCNPDTRILVMIPISGRSRKEVTTAVESYLTTAKDRHTHLIDLGTIAFDTSDGQHPTAAGHRAVFNAALPHFDKLVPRTR